jgi:hypothetical protein
VDLRSLGNILTIRGFRVVRQAQIMARLTSTEPQMASVAR